jgi:hypothetical protein
LLGEEAQLILLKDGERPEALKLDVGFSPALWEALEATRVFQATPERRGAQFGEWNSEDPIRVELELEPSVFTALLLTTEDLFDMGSSLLKGQLGLADVRNWKVRLARQQQGDVRVGVRFKE